MRPARACEPSSGIGLTNVRRRLELCYGPEAHFDIRSANGVTAVAFVLPRGPMAHALVRAASPSVGDA